MEMLSAFTDVLHVANLSTGAHLISIIKQVRHYPRNCNIQIHKTPTICHVNLLLQSDAFTKEDIAKLASKLSGRKACIGVKKLLGLIDMVKQTDPR